MAVQDKVPYQREVRLGLVLYGGVSLAVYENGIAQEIHRAIRGDNNSVYGLLAKLIDSDVVVDIVSGTSAGGVNGIMLSYALANGLSFEPSAALWLEDGDIMKLMRSHDDLEASSILNSKYYQDRLENCYAKGLTTDETHPTIEELDLFVTSTDANGALSTVYDDLGHAVDIKNHRALFKLSYRGERKNNFKAPAKDLAKLSRMTSCFPVAFQPVEVDDTNIDTGTAEDTDKNFFRWGKLRNSAVYLDGGILNNKPFTSTIDAIASRTSTREVERFLIYVEPNPEQFKPNPETPIAPAMVQAAVGSLLSIPGYQSIAADLQAIESHNERASRVKQIFGELEAADPCSTNDLLYADVLLPPKETIAATAYYAARSIQIRDVAVSGILDDAKGRGYFPNPNLNAAAKAGTPPSAQDDRRSGRILVQSFDAWEGDGETTLLNYDVFFRMRRTVHLRNTLMRAAKGETKDAVKVPAEVWDTINHYYKLYEMAKWAMLQRVTLQDLKWQRLSSENPTLDTQLKEDQQKTLADIASQMWGQVIILMEPLMYASITIPSVTTGGEKEAQKAQEAREKFYKQLGSLQDGTAAFAKRETNLLDAIDTALKQAIITLQGSSNPLTASIAGTLCNEFCRFPEVDRRLFLLQFGSGFESTDLIRVVRFSPLDAQRALSQGAPQDKVRGITLGAFGGFFKKSWRANDIMMGRLDASCLLIECLLTRERLAALAPRRVGANAVTVTADELRRYLPELKEKAPALAADINAYLANPIHATTDQWNDIIDGIVKPYHDQIFREEYPRVVQCAIEQEHTWGRYRQTAVDPSSSTYDPKNQVWIRGQQRPDETIVKTAALAHAAQSVEPFAPGSSPSNPFTEEIPESILQELGALATLHLGRGLLASITNPGPRQKVANSRFYKYPFTILAPTVYGLSKMRRTDPTSVIIFNTLFPAIFGTIFLLPLVLLYLHTIPWRPALGFALPALLILIGWNIAFRD